MDDYAFLKDPILSSTKFISSQWNPYREQAWGVADLQNVTAYYRPMAHMAYDFCYDTFKRHYWQYHLLNLFLFVLASSLIYLLVEKLSGNGVLAFLAGVFYLIHPINGVVVNYISACVFSFQMIFMLGTILLLWESLERNNNQALYALSLAFSFLSLFWHESGIMTPFYLSAVILLFGKRPLKKKVLCLFPYFLIIFSYLVFRFLMMDTDKDVLNRMLIFHQTGLEHPAALFQLLMWYITRLFYPQGIVLIWAAPILRQPVFWNCVGLCALGAVCILLFVRFAKERMIQLSLIWLLVGFAPVCLAGFRNPDTAAQIEPHWFIFSSVGFFILAAYCYWVVLKRTRKIGAVSLFIIIIAWAAVSHSYNQLWADQKTYAFYWSRQVPDLKLTYFYLAEAYQKEGDLQGSRKYYRRALSGHFSDIKIYNNLGVIDDSEGHLKEAEYNYKRGLKIYRHSSYAYNNLGALYLKGGQEEKADQCFRQARAYNPLMLEPRRGLAAIALNHSDYREAVDLCLINLGIVHDDADTLFLLLDIYLQKRDLVNIKKYAYRMINFETDPEVLTKLGIGMAQNNEPEIAMDSFIKVLRLAPDYKDAYFAAEILLHKEPGRGR